jgi:hypothetical protein
MARGDLTAAHYLRLYRLKLDMARASPDGMSFMRQLVDALSSLDPNTPVRLDTSNDEMIFINALTGATLAQLRLGDV